MPKRKGYSGKMAAHRKYTTKASTGGAKKGKKPSMSREEKVRAIEDTLGDMEV